MTRRRTRQLKEVTPVEGFTLQPWEATKLWRYENGSLYWLKAQRTIDEPLLCYEVGDLADIDMSDYVGVVYRRKIYKIENVIWVMHNKYLRLGEEVIHLDEDNKNNKIENLQLK
jgi:hypothetical protein